MNKTVGMISLGCAKNRYDSESMLGVLSNAGWIIVNKPEDAHLLIINTCGFIESAKSESISTILEYADMRERTGMPEKILVTGCLSQRYPAELYEEIPEVDGFLGVAQYDKLLETINDIENATRPQHYECQQLFPEVKRILTTPKWSSYIKISDGCDNRCTFCAIPLIRGRYHSRPYGDIVAEAKSLACDGVTEITLIAQDTSRYGTDMGGKTLLASLMRDIHDIEGIKWLRVLYCYPDTVNEELLDTIADLPKACRYLDLPLQHINDYLLKRMNRRGDSETIRNVIRMCKERAISIRTTFIVGFPGETEEMFRELMDFVRETRFDKLGAFAYSPEEGTAAAVMPDQIPEEIKQQRYDRLMRLQQGISRENLRKRLGSVCEVLCEGRDKHARYIGRSEFEAPEVDGLIHFTSEKPLNPGEYVNVRILAGKAYDLIGEAL